MNEHGSFMFLGFYVVGIFYQRIWIDGGTQLYSIYFKLLKKYLGIMENNVYTIMYF